MKWSDFSVLNTEKKSKPVRKLRRKLGGIKIAVVICYQIDYASP